jgi:hypothetical protein
MSFSSDASPTSSLPSSPSTSATAPSSPNSTNGDLHDSEYRAPLNGEAPEPSIDGTSVGGGEGGLRALSLEEVGKEEKVVSLPLRLGDETLVQLEEVCSQHLSTRYLTRRELPPPRPPARGAGLAGELEGRWKALKMLRGYVSDD